MPIAMQRISLVFLPHSIKVLSELLLQGKEEEGRGCTHCGKVSGANLEEAAESLEVDWLRLTVRHPTTIAHSAHRHAAARLRIPFRFLH